MADTPEQTDETSSAGDITWDWVAELYDAYVTTTADLPFYLAETAGFTGEALELMCGTGRVSLPLAEAGVRLTCVDASAGMLARLREKLAQAPSGGAQYHRNRGGRAAAGARPSVRPDPAAVPLVL